MSCRALSIEEVSQRRISQAVPRQRLRSTSRPERKPGQQPQRCPGVARPKAICRNEAPLVSRIAPQRAQWAGPNESQGNRSAALETQDPKTQNASTGFHVLRAEKAGRVIRIQVSLARRANNRTRTPSPRLSIAIDAADVVWHLSAHRSTTLQRQCRPKFRPWRTRCVQRRPGNHQR